MRSQGRLGRSVLTVHDGAQQQGLPHAQHGSVIQELHWGHDHIGRNGRSVTDLAQIDKGGARKRVRCASGVGEHAHVLPSCGADARAHFVRCVLEESGKLLVRERMHDGQLVELHLVVYVIAAGKLLRGKQPISVGDFNNKALCQPAVLCIGLILRAQLQSAWLMLR